MGILWLRYRRQEGGHRCRRSRRPLRRGRPGPGPSGTSRVKDYFLLNWFSLLCTCQNCVCGKIDVAAQITSMDSIYRNLEKKEDLGLVRRLAVFSHLFQGLGVV